MNELAGKDPALVIAADANGLGAVRGLAAAGIRVRAVAAAPDDPVVHSEVPEKVDVLTAKPFDADELLGLLLADDVPPSVVVPTSDRFVSVLDQNREQLESRHRLAIPPSTVVRRMIDKAEEYEWLHSIGVDLPVTLSRLAESSDQFLRELRLPVIVKPRSFEFYRRLGRKNVVLSSDAERQRFLDDYGDRLDGLIAQEVIVGPDSNQWVCNATYDAASQRIGSFSFRRLRLSPAHYGVTSLGIAEHNASVKSATDKIAAGIHYHGTMMMEFKYDERDNRYLYLELNPRLGMCNALDRRCGVNNAALSYCVAVGLEDPEIYSALASDPQQDGVYFFAAYDDFYARKQAGESLLAIARDHLSMSGKSKIGPYSDAADPQPSRAQRRARARDLTSGIRRKLGF